MTTSSAHAPPALYLHAPISGFGYAIAVANAIANADADAIANANANANAPYSFRRTVGVTDRPSKRFASPSTNSGSMKGS